jgi:hypothetical protein
MARVSCYIDGFNLYHAISDLGRPELKWLSLKALAKSYLERQDTLAGVTYFTAVQKRFAEKARRHVAYIDALRATGVEVVESRFTKAKKYCSSYGRYCSFDFEKQTDVAFAVRVLSDAYCRISSDRTHPISSVGYHLIS